MIVINTVDSQKFSLNGIEYFKNFTPVVNGDTIRVLNTYDSCIEIVNSTNYADFEVDGNTFASVSLLQSALLPIIYTRDSLSTTGIAIVSNIATTYGVDWSAADHWDLTMTANTTITESNIPIAGKVKTITIELKGNFSPTLPVAWGILGTYDGVNGSQLVIQSWNNGSYYAIFNDLV